jgi:hypothetical protein
LVQRLSYGTEAVFAPGLELLTAGLGDEDRDGSRLIDSLLAQQRMRCVEVRHGRKDLRLKQLWIKLQLPNECRAVAKSFDEPKVVADLADALIKDQRCR